MENVVENVVENVGRMSHYGYIIHLNLTAFCLLSINIFPRTRNHIIQLILTAFWLLSTDIFLTTKQNSSFVVRKMLVESSQKAVKIN